MRVQKPAQVASTNNAARVAALKTIRVVAIPESKLWLYSGDNMARLVQGVPLDIM